MLERLPSEFLRAIAPHAVTSNPERKIMLSGKQKRYLRGVGHGLKAVVTVGKGEITEAVLRETTGMLAVHELIKVKVLESCMVDRHEVAEALATGCDAEVVQILGRTLLLYRQGDEPKIELPKGK